MTIEIFLFVILLGLPAAYPLRCLILEQKESHEGPFPSSNKVVLWARQSSRGEWLIEHKQRVAMWDWIRRIFFVYEVGEEGTWRVRTESAWSELFSCPFCLSFWIAGFFSVPFVIFSGLYEWLPVFHLSIAISSQVVYKRLFD